MNTRIYFLSIMTFLGGWGTLSAQNDPLAGQDSIVLENERIEDVIESQKPFLKPPYQEVEEASQDDFTFQSQDFYVETDFEPAPPDIKAWPRERKEDLKNGILRLGIGRFVTPYAQLSLANGRDGNGAFNLDFTHLSAHRDNIPLRKFRRDYGTATLKSIQQDYTITALAHVYNTSYFPYADTVFLDNPERREDSLRIGYTRIRGGAQFETNYNHDALFEANSGVYLRFFAGNRGNIETNFDLFPNAAYLITPEFKAGLESTVTLSQGRLDTSSGNRLFLDAAPYLAYDNGTFSLKAGVRYNWFNNTLDTASQSNFGGLVEVSAAIVPDQFSFLAGYSVGMQNHTYYDLIHQNPYLMREVFIQPSIERLNLYVGGKGNVGDDIDYSLRVYYKRVQNQLMFVTDENGFYFDLAYDSLMTILGTQAEVNFSPIENLDVGGTLNLNIFNPSTLERYFHASPLRLDVFGIYSWDDKLTARADLNIFGPRPMALNAAGEVIRQGPFVGINLSGDYRITEGFSVFLSVNNLLSSNYQRWHNYPERRIDFMGGVSIAF